MMRWARTWGFVLLCGCGVPVREIALPPSSPGTLASTPPATALAPTPAPSAAANDASPDAVAFEEALALRDRHDAAAGGALARFVRDWPQSPRVPDAYVAAADLAFEQAGTDPARLQDARQGYQAALAIPPPENRVWGYAAYKLAYVFWNAGEHQKALAALKHAIDFGARYPQVEGAAKIRDAALRDVAPLYAEVGAPDRARAFFKVLSGDDAKARAMLLALASLYDDKGKFTEARTVLVDLKTYDAADACVYDVRARYAVPNKNLAAEAAELAKCPPRSAP